MCLHLTSNAAGHFTPLSRVILDVAEAADGGMFVLFTSHRDIRAMAAELRARGIERRWPMLVHGDETRDVLLARFRDSGKAILLGTASFWEGVDVPGDALQALIIAKLPFRVPTEPITAAHCEAITARGGDAFNEYMLPHAALRLKQGFGRLVRSSADRGVVVIADPRVVTQGLWPWTHRRTSAGQDALLDVGPISSNRFASSITDRYDHHATSITVTTRPSKIVCVGRNYRRPRQGIGQRCPEPNR